MNFHKLEQWHNAYKEANLQGRYVTADHLRPLIELYGEGFKVDIIGYSVEDRPIHTIKVGNGPLKILAWSQMHGNESTTTKALFDFLKYCATQTEENVELLSKITLLIIPILNPDGAERYTRLNANGMDLNRDAQNLTQPESKILKETYTRYKPDYCFNLHGQRTIFGVGEPKKIATVSLLSPSQDPERTVTESRLKGMVVINSIRQTLEEFIPGGVGRYDDGFNINCVGDTLQHLNIPTILFEAGHFPQDYGREQTRLFIFLALMSALDCIANHTVVNSNTRRKYFEIPDNKICFYDIVLRNARTRYNRVDIAIQYEEILENKEVKFVPKVQKIAKLSDFTGHREYDLKERKLTQLSDNEIVEGVILNKIKVNSGDTITFSVN